MFGAWIKTGGAFAATHPQNTRKLPGENLQVSHRFRLGSVPGDALPGLPDRGRYNIGIQRVLGGDFLGFAERRQGSQSSMIVLYKLS